MEIESTEGRSKPTAIPGSNQQKRGLVQSGL